MGSLKATYHVLILMLFISSTAATIVASADCRSPTKPHRPKHPKNPKSPLPHPPFVKPPFIKPPSVTPPPYIEPPYVKPPITIPPPIVYPPPVINPPVINPPSGGGIVPCPPPPTSTTPSTETCSIGTLKLGACVDLLGGLIHIGLGDPVVNECCPIIQGLVELEAAVCLCTTIKIKLLNLNIFVPLALQLLVTCGKTPPPGYTCTI